MIAPGGKVRAEISEGVQLISSVFPQLTALPGVVPVAFVMRAEVF